MREKKKQNIHRYVEPKKTFYIGFVKRSIDIIFSFLGIVLLSPLFIIIYIVMAIDLGFPVIFKQERVGRSCKIFTIYKFRNMNFKKDADGNLLPPNERLTKIGKILRTLSLDEIPQLFNILKGDMSIIGPRPLLPKYIDLYTDKHIQRHAVRPGLENPQIKKITKRTWYEQFENDVEYVNRCSFALDIAQCFRLVKMVFNIGGNSERNEATRKALTKDYTEEV